ncbi:transposase [Sulfurimonas lithotrophica]|uniref:Transposase n=1 Tax=Sulfurimonas lithotrophica TaxID=2590022 RepID=A0A5P8P242_9BACT|nr:Mu transposase C-terminal domain-containing protein [Sulfurimonas lithotrophica]QFR49792.1 transposase [Sulfurimonas lithotrophica]
MSKLSLSIGSKVFYQNKEYEIVKAIDFKTLSIRPLDNKFEIIDVAIKDLSSKPVEDKVQLDTFTDEEWNEAKEKYEAIKELVFRKKTRSEVEKVAEQQKVTAKTIYLWIKDYETSEKVSSLISNKHKRGKKGNRLDPLVNKIIEDVIEELYLTKQRIGFSKIYDTIKSECKKSNLTPPNHQTVRNRIKAIDPKFALKKRFSSKKANEEYGNFEGEYPEGDFPLEVYQVDHTPLDIIVVDPIFRKPIGRPYLTLAIDIYSRMVAGFYISLQAPGYFSVSQCLYNAFLPKDDFLKKQGIKGEWEIYGIPSKYAVDNGKDLIGLDMQRVCDELGMSMTRRPVGRPQYGAHVERVLGTINKKIHDLPGSTKSNIVDKGEYDSVKNATFTLDEITKWVTEFIVNVYHNRIHHGIGMTPKQKYKIGIFGDDENPGTGIPPIIENPESIRIALLPTYYRTTQKNGITLDGITYYSDVLRTWINKTDEKGNKLKFKVKRDPLNIQKLYFFDPEIKEYFELNYRKLHAPKMTLWDMLVAKRYLKEKNIKDYNEDDIFDAYDRLTEIEKEAKEKTKKHKLRKSKSHKMVDIEMKKEAAKENEPTETIKETVVKKEDNKSSDLFANIKLFNVKEK